MESEKSRFLAKRAESLATMVLTRHPDVVIDRPSQDMGIDFLVQLKSKLGGAELFGIEVKAYLDIDRALSNNRSRVRASVAKALSRSVENATFPVGLLIFDMKTDDGYYGWVLQPSTSSGAGPSLETSLPIPVSVLDSKYLNQVVADVRSWYAARLKRRRASA